MVDRGDCPLQCKDWSEEDAEYEQENQSDVQIATTASFRSECLLDPVLLLLFRIPHRDERSREV